MTSTGPFDSFRDAVKHLRRPFSPLALRWKVQSAWEHGALVVCYIDRGLVIDRLNMLVPELWSATYDDLDRGYMRCTLTIGQTARVDVGHGTDPKSRYTDALKRAAVHFGVGVSLTRVPQSRLRVSDSLVKIRPAKDPGKWAGEPTQEGLNYLRGRYSQWLAVIGTSVFGESLEHGDQGDAQGDTDVSETGGLADEDTRADLLAALTDGSWTVKQQRGFLAAAGVTGLPSVPTPEHIADATEALTTEQADRVARLIEQGGAHE